MTAEKASETTAREAEIAEARSLTATTRRATVPALEEMLYRPVKVLDHGFVRVVDYMGSDDAVVQAARVSYGRGTKQVSNDRGLIRYLLRHRHTTPFEMCEIKLHVKLPIFVARQWIRHRTANVNEYSARYSRMDREFYVPNTEHLASELESVRRRRDDKAVGDLFGGSGAGAGPAELAEQSTTNKQGREGALEQDDARYAVSRIDWISRQAYGVYENLLNEDEAGEPKDPDRRGLARELARMVLPVNVYTQWYWKIDLHNLLHFISLRADSHAQYEIRAYAEAIAELVKLWVPITFEAFQDYRQGGIGLSGPALAVVRKMLAGEPVDMEASGLSKREWRELMEVLGREP
ncbi:MAG: FAD-dependent thymidylate synthase [Alphaproteobacteria bacterium]